MGMKTTTEIKNTEFARRYYSGGFPDRLYLHGKAMSTSPDAADTESVFAETKTEEEASFIRELFRRWNLYPTLEQGLMDIREMASKRKSCIRMPSGLMLDTFCGITLKGEAHE